MSAPVAPRTGQVFAYPYLWARQDERGETEGRKSRPCCMALVVPLKDGTSRVYLLPLTTQPPVPGRLALSVPRTEAARAGLDGTPCWLMLDEWNADLWEGSYYFEDRRPFGAFARRFMTTALKELRRALSHGKLRTVDRT